VIRLKYGYDHVGNRTYRENIVGPGALDEFYSYDGAHRLKTFDRGNLTGTPPTGIASTP